jgi:DNA-binding NarL/FixJ family response regulator
VTRPAGRLTRREMQVLRLMSHAKTNKQIGVALFISENTVKTHVRNILAHFKVGSRMEAVTCAWRTGVLEADF